MTVLVFTSFVPVIQILIVTLNGAILYPFSVLIESKDVFESFVLSIDGFISLLGLVFFYKSKKLFWVVLSAIFTVLFLLPFMVFVFGYIETELYFLQNLLAGFSVGLILLFFALLKKYSI
jgi:hypothetical protein